MRKPRFSKEDWVQLGLTELSRQGPDAVKLEAICKAAGLTRGSFYHHFDDHETFLAAMATRWFETQTTQIADGIDSASPPKAQGDALTAAALTIDYRLELGIRELARRLPVVQAIVAQADQVRLAVVAKIYQGRFGLEDAAAQDFAYLEYAAFSGILLLNPDMDKDRQRHLAEMYEQVMVQALGQEK